jgi:C4-dicarboxylate transporter DctM subunit
MNELTNSAHGKPLRALAIAEDAAGVTAVSLMALLPAAEFLARGAGLSGVPGSTVLVQHLTLWVAMLGGAQAARSGRLLSLSAITFLPERWAAPLRIACSGLTAAIAAALGWASWQFVLSQREGGAIVALGIARWVAQLVMPCGFALIAARAILGAGPRVSHRAVAAFFLLIPVFLHFAPQPQGNALLWIAIGAIIAGAILGLPIFATLGGIALLLFWNAGLPVASAPVEMYRLVASPILPSLPLFTLAGYLLVEGGAGTRLLRVFSSLLGWLPGGLAITTAVSCAIFTWAGSGVTILSLGGLLLPMLVKARYSERFSVGLINGSGSLGLLFPPSLPVILYGIYSQTAISTLFVAGLAPGLMMVAMVAAWGVLQAVRCGAQRAPFSFAEAREAIWEAKWELAVPFLVLIGLFGGFGTLVEAGAITVVYCLVAERLVSPHFSIRRDFPRVTLECVTVVGGALMIIGAAVGLTSYLVASGVPAQLIGWANAHIRSKYAFLLLLNLVLLVSGTFMDVFSAIIVLAPLVVPIGLRFDIDPVQLGIIFLANLELGYLTPPIGMNLCLSAYRFKLPMAAVYRATLPVYLILLAGVLLITYLPALTTLPVKWLGL